MKIIEGKTDGAPYRIAVVVSRFNDLIGQRLLKGALETLRFKGVGDDSIEVAWVPGAWEIPVVARAFLRTGRFQGVITLGAIIRGETTHHEHIASGVSSALARLTEETGAPVSFGVLTTETLEQALARAGDTTNNKGAEAALHLLETLSVLGQVR